MLCPWQGREKVNFLTSKEASWRSRLSANGKGGAARTNFSYHSSITVQLPLTRPLPVPILSGRGGGWLFPEGTLHSRRTWNNSTAMLMAQLKQHSEHRKHQLSIICKSSLSFSQKHSRNHVPSLPSFVENDFFFFFFRNVKRCCRRSWESPDTL